MYREDDGTFEPYPVEINMKIENAYFGKAPDIEWEEDGDIYRISFSTMSEIIIGAMDESSTEVRRKG